MTAPPRDRDRGHYPGYDVLAKRDTMSWDQRTRRAVDQRLAVARQARFFSDAEFATLEAVSRRIVPQPDDRPAIPVAALLDGNLAAGNTQGFRVGALPHDGEAWRIGLAALEAEARAAFGMGFAALAPEQQDGLLRQAQQGALKDAAWGEMKCTLFFDKRVLTDMVTMYYGHPTAWSEMGFGGPASPRGYVRMELNRRDPWEAEEAKAGVSVARVREVNRHVG